jgi:hypothetical protein
VTEELESSLLKSVETFLNERLQSIESQLSRLQTDFHDALVRARETAASTALENSPLASAISGHLQAAREQKLSGSATTSAPTLDLSALKTGIQEVQNERTQSDVLSALLKAGARFADRTMLFVVKGNQAIAWRMCQANSEEVEPVSGIAVALVDDNIVGRAARSRLTETMTTGSGDGPGLIPQLSAEAQQAVAIPLVVRNKVVAVLYADSTWPHPDSLQLEALEILERVATMAVELVSAPRVAQAPQPATQPSAPPAAPPASDVEAAQEPASEVAVEETSDVAPAEAAAPQVEPEQAEADTTETAAVPETVTSTEPAQPSQPPAKAAEPSFAPQYSAPLGSARRFGVSEPELPIEVSEEERRLHNDARRFARLLVSEIKLYNEQKVSEGRSQGNLYDRLQDDIDRSRQMYDKRVAPPVAARHDYFHQELVNLLAEGDASKLGGNYPGAALAA